MSTTPVVTSKRCVQVDQNDFEQMLTNYRLILARSDKQELQLKALNKVSQFAAQTEGALKIEKKRSRQFESAYIASEAKLGHLIKTLLLKKEDRRSDVEILESLLGLKTDELYTGYVDRERLGVSGNGCTSTEWKSGTHGQGVRPTKGDLETDGGLGSAKAVKRESVKNTTAQGHNEEDSGTPDPPLEHKFQEKDLVDMGSRHSPEILQNMVKEQRRLQSIIKEFREQTPDAWKAYADYKQYEDIVKSLRLEVASLRINCTEHQQLLMAKRGNRTDELCNKLVEVEKQVEKLTKELNTTQYLLQCKNDEYRQIKDENQSLRLRLGEGMSGQEEIFQEYQKMSASVDRLRREKRELEEECQKCRGLLESVLPPAVRDESYSTTSWSELWDKTQKMEQDMESYRHELEQKERAQEVIKAQFQILEENLNDQKKENQTLRERETQYQEQVQRLKQDCDQLQHQFSSTHEQYNKQLIENQNLKQQNAEFTSILTQRTGRQVSSNQGQFRSDFCAVFAGGSLGPPRQGLIEADGVSLPPEDRDPKPRSSPAKVGWGDQPTVRQTDAVSKLQAQHVSEKILECPQCQREFKPTEKQKFEEHKKKCVP